MSFTLEQVVPWGRSYEEYVAMFALSARDLQQRILGCGDGPAAFNAGLTLRGGRTVAVDPLYGYSAQAIRKRIDAVFAEVLEQTRKNSVDFIWENIPSVDELGRLRMAAMEEFLADYPAGRKQGRYVNGELPRLPFADRAFGLALCSHFLFLYSEHLSAEFHLASIRELCRVAAEARVFPLLELGTRKSRHLDAVSTALMATGFDVRIEPVPYEFQRGGNQMLRVSPAGFKEK